MDKNVKALIAALEAKGKNEQAARVKDAFELTQMPEFATAMQDILADGVDDSELVSLVVAGILVG